MVRAIEVVRKRRPDQLRIHRFRAIRGLIASLEVEAPVACLVVYRLIHLISHFSRLLIDKRSEKIIVVNEVEQTLFPSKSIPRRYYRRRFGIALFENRRALEMLWS